MPNGHRYRFFAKIKNEFRNSLSIWIEQSSDSSFLGSFHGFPLLFHQFKRKGRRHFGFIEANPGSGICSIFDIDFKNISKFIDLENT
ncbi:MAG: hypothetical protein R2783_03335 [Gelidibacter sp.]